MRTIFVSAIIALTAVPAFGAEFYIVQDNKKQTCQITHEVPKATIM